MHQQRKSDHLVINLNEDVDFDGITSGLERYRFVHQAVPELNLRDIDLHTEFLGKRMAVPLLISAMTGGTPEAREINLRLAAAAQAAGIGMGVGSQRAAIEDPSLADSYQVRSAAPDIILLANLGAIQLNHGYRIDQCRQAIEMIEADALVLHLNPLQEALQSGGDTDFAGLLQAIESVCRALEVPVIAKEVGWGISERAARQLANAGVYAIDVAGAGGTSWSTVEMHRAPTERDRQIAAAFSGWGIPTAESLLMTRRGAPRLPIIASGGIRDGISVAKALALGASLCGMARPFLQAAADSRNAVAQIIDIVTAQLRIAMQAAGAASIDVLRRTSLQRLD